MNFTTLQDGVLVGSDNGRSGSSIDEISFKKKSINYYSQIPDFQ